MENRIYYKDDYVEVWNANSINLDFIHDNSIHIVITSPPYNTGMPYNSYNDEQSKPKYLDMLEKVFTECYKKMVKGAKICVNVPSCLAQTRHSKIGFLSVSVHNLLKQIGFIPYAWIYWSKIVNCNKNSTSWGSWLSPSCPSIRDIGDEYIIIMAKKIVLRLKYHKML